MKTFEEQNATLIEFDKTFDSTNFNHCVRRAVLLLKNREAEAAESGNEFNFVISRWSVEQAIINRHSSKSMIFAAIEYVGKIEKMIELAI